MVKKIMTYCIVGFVFMAMSANGFAAADPPQPQLQLQKFTGTPSGGTLGHATAVDGTILVVSAVSGDKVHVFELTDPATPGDPLDDTWSHVAVLTSSVPGSAPRFGEAIAISGDTIVVSSTLENSAAGVVYVFIKPGGGWIDATEDARLTIAGTPSDRFLGASLAIKDDETRIVAGAPGNPGIVGKVHIYEKPGGGWISATESASISGSDGEVGDNFGGDVDLGPGGTVLAVGAPRWGLASFSSTIGAVYMYRHNGSIYAEEATTLQSALTTAGDRFGGLVEVSDDVMVAVATVGQHISVYKYSGTWVEDEAFFMPHEAFGLSGLDMDDADDSRFLIGDSLAFPTDTGLSSKGYAVLFEEVLGTWKVALELHPSDPAIDGNYGASVALQGDLALMGSTGIDSFAGAVYYNNLSDYDNDTILNGSDNCPKNDNLAQTDIDTDGAGDPCDNCPGLINISQADADEDLTGDDCETCDLDPDKIAPGYR